MLEKEDYAIHRLALHLPYKFVRFVRSDQIPIHPKIAKAFIMGIKGMPACGRDHGEK